MDSPVVSVVVRAPELKPSDVVRVYVVIGDLVRMTEPLRDQLLVVAQRLMIATGSEIDNLLSTDHILDLVGDPRRGPSARRLACAVLAIRPAPVTRIVDYALVGL